MINPFNPGAGRRPPYLAGRSKIVGGIAADMRSVYESLVGARPIILSGLRGMGKTVLAQSLATAARNQGWVVIWVEASAGESLAKKLAQAIYVELRRIKSSGSAASSFFDHAASVLKSFQLKIDPAGAVSFGLDVTPAKGYADSGDLSLDLSDMFSALGDAARESETAVFVAIDELQEASSKDLEALNVALHSVGQGIDPVPIFFMGVGLPTLPSVLAEASSYAERLYRFYSIDNLSAEDAQAAYTEPVVSCDISWEPDALDLAVQAAGGYPYFIQQCGFCVCEQMSEGSVIGIAEAAAGIALAKDELDAGIYSSRWNRLSGAGKEFLTAMSDFDMPVLLSDIAAALGKKSVSALSVARERLIADGVIYSPSRGTLDFTIPGMAEYIKTNKDK